MYRYLLKPLFFKFPPETIHHLVFRVLRILVKIPGISTLFKSVFVVRDKRLQKKVMGLNFFSPVGLAAGFDKDGELYHELINFGFGFIDRRFNHYLACRFYIVLIDVLFNERQERGAELIDLTHTHTVDLRHLLLGCRIGGRHFFQ